MYQDGAQEQNVVVYCSLQSCLRASVYSVRHEPIVWHLECTALRPQAFTPTSSGSKHHHPVSRTGRCCVIPRILRGEYSAVSYTRSHADARMHIGWLEVEKSPESCLPCRKRRGGPRAMASHRVLVRCRIGRFDAPQVDANGVDAARPRGPRSTP